MVSRLNDIPVYEQTAVTVSAADYNLVTLALKRLGEPLQVSLPGLRTLALILDREAWVVIDTSLNDIPVLAWTEFQAQHRQNLHEPIACLRKIYHSHALIICNKVNDIMRNDLGRRLGEGSTPDPASRVSHIGDKKS